MSEVWKQFEKIMLDKGLVKTADKKDESYNVVPDKAGPDIPVEETGYELVEIAHPDQVQVAHSRLNDGIVENGVERQKIMIDVALRNPRGVLAEVMQTLVKAANVLEEDLSDESIKLASDIDDILKKLAQAKPKRVSANFADLLEAVNKVADAFRDQKFTTFGTFESTEAKKTLEAAGARMRNYSRQARQTAGDQEKLALGQEITAYVIESNAKVKDAVDSIRSKVTLWGMDPKQVATDAWNDLYEQAETWNTIAPSAAPKPQSEEDLLGHRGVLQRERKKEEAPQVAVQPQAAPGMSGKLPSRHNYSVGGPQDPEGSALVKQLQGILGVDQDGKLGPQTFAALMGEAKKNYNLQSYLENAPHYTKGFQGWDKGAVRESIHNIQKFRQTKPEGSTSPPPLIPPPPEAQEERNGWQRLDNNRWVDKNTGRVITLNNPVPMK